jgi:prophage tail gpP-like protein
MTGILSLYDGTSYTLPVPVAWEMDYTAGVPCDSFWLRFPAGAETVAVLRKAVGFTATEEGERVFTGLVDEFHLDWAGDGAMAELSGRGMAARLLDNESRAQTYEVATTAAILRDHVTCYGVEVGNSGSLRAVPGFTVSSGSSEWSVLYQFAQYYSRVTPRFDRWGRLLLSPFGSEVSRRLDRTLPIIGLRYGETRYGCLSSVLVQSKNQAYSTTVTDPDFIAQGGNARQVVTMPNNGAYEAMRYSGQYQLEKARQERFALEVTVALPFWGWPGEVVQVAVDEAGCSGTWRIRQCQVCLDGDGQRSVVTLVPTDALI